MAKQETQPFDPNATITSEEGLRYLPDPFEKGEHQLVGVADAGEWEVLEEDFGPEVDWAITPTVAGKLVATKTVQIDHNDDRGPVDTNLYSIEDAVTGERRMFYGNYQIDNALQGDKYIGRTIYLEHKGKRDQGKGGRSLNVFTILVKREPVS